MSIEYLPDIHEQGEARCESYIEGDKVRCAACDGLFCRDEIDCWGPDPYGTPICVTCMEKADDE